MGGRAGKKSLETHELATLVDIDVNNKKTSQTRWKESGVTSGLHLNAVACMPALTYMSMYTYIYRYIHTHTTKNQDPR